MKWKFCNRNKCGYDGSLWGMEVISMISLLGCMDVRFVNENVGIFVRLFISKWCI